MIVAIDGPAGAGKSTVAKAVAKRLGYRYMDTGAMYRALAWKVMSHGTDPGDEVALGRILRNTAVDLGADADAPSVMLDGVDVSGAIRTAEVGQVASRVSGLGIVRERMAELQRAMGRGGAVVAEGRDMGTVVFPEAAVKVYLDASPETRARRRFGELAGKEPDLTLEETLADVMRRDRRDKERAVAPLRRADDAVFIDSTLLPVEAVVEQVLQAVKKKSNENGRIVS
ncbi:MAG: (d)CMP kinase [Deltaproteobacteria bacterium]|nr:(d)CMP kinase [Deltaproteobacteria bacterium]